MTSNDLVPPARANRARTTADHLLDRRTAPPRRRRWSRKKISILLVACTLLVFAMKRSEDPVDRMDAPAPVEEELAVVAEETPGEREAEDKAALDCKVYPYKHFSKYLKDRLNTYKSQSLQAGIMPLKNDDALMELISGGSGSLELVKDDEAMHIAEMDHGKPYLTPQAHSVLRRIASDFKARIADTDLADARLRVTSLLRTSKDQRDLGRSNVNATRDVDAPHTHGTSMDISYMKFMMQDGQMMELSGCQQVFLAETLAEVIHDLRKKDQNIFAVRERRQACYHLTVCR